MVKQVYSFYDMKVRVYHPPMVLLNDNEATRLAADVVADKQTPLGRYPADFRLVKIAEFDDNVGLITPLSHPEPICDLITLTKGLDKRTEDFVIDVSKEV